MSETNAPERISKTSIIAIVAAILSFFVTALPGFILAGIAFLFGILGGIKAMSDKVRGGLMSIMAILGGVLGVIAALMKAIF